MLNWYWKGFSYLSGGFNALNQTQNGHNPRCEQAQSQLPAYTAQIIYSVAHLQHVVSAKKTNS